MQLEEGGARRGLKIGCKDLENIKSSRAKFYRNTRSIDLDLSTRSTNSSFIFFYYFRRPPFFLVIPSFEGKHSASSSPRKKLETCQSPSNSRSFRLDEYPVETSIHRRNYHACNSHASTNLARAKNRSISIGVGPSAE